MFDVGQDDAGVHFDEDGRPVWDDDVDIGDIPISDDDDTNIVFPSIEQPSKKEKKKKKKRRKEGRTTEAVWISMLWMPTSLLDSTRTKNGMEQRRCGNVNSTSTWTKSMALISMTWYMASLISTMPTNECFFDRSATCLRGSNTFQFNLKHTHFRQPKS